MNESIPAVILGGTGYVAGELLRLIVQHPQLYLSAAVSDSQAGVPIRTVFPNLHDSFGDQTFVPRERLTEHLSGKVAVFSAAPHGASAALVADTIAAGAERSAELTIVDTSADFRYATAPEYEAVYGRPHGAPDLLDRFTCSVPEHFSATPSAYIGHPGCFATAILLAAVPLLTLKLVGPEIYAVGITGSTGSGRKPAPNTHHPLRHANLFAYKPLTHRHAPEVAAVCRSLMDIEPVLRFVPHSGPFARGIHMTLQAQLTSPVSETELRQALRDFYADHRFVQVVDGTPHLKDVVGSNYCHLGVAVDGNSLVLLSVIDNLIKGAAGGAMQWMNRQLGFDEYAGLNVLGPAWI